MTSLRERLRAGDPARAARPLDADEVAAIRRAMAAPRPEPRRWPITAGLALAAAAVAVAAVVLWPSRAPSPIPAPVVRVERPPLVEVPPEAPPMVAQVPAPAPRRRRAAPPPSPPAEPAQVKEIRFVTASGTQILWTVRSSEEGA